MPTNNFFSGGMIQFKVHLKIRDCLGEAYDVMGKKDAYDVL